MDTGAPARAWAGVISAPNFLSTQTGFWFHSPSMNQRLRTLLLLGRVSNLPTVWSNCLAGWWLGGGWNAENLPWLFLGVTLLYCGGMFLNDAFDQQFDRLRRPERPIPSGKIPAMQVWFLGFGLLAAGVLTLHPCGRAAFYAALLLAFFIVLYDFTHKFLMASPWLMGACRFWVYVVAGATGADRWSGYALDGFPIFGGVALALYVVGLSYVARRESTRRPVPYWPLALLAAPVLLAMAINTGDYRVRAAWLSLLLIVWVLRYVTLLVWRRSHTGWIVGNLLAGIVLVDWLAVGPQLPWPKLLIFPILFGLTKSMQKFIPAT